MLLIYTHTVTPRLQYIVDFFSKELFEEGIRITTDVASYQQAVQPRINYSAREFSEQELFIAATPLLFETTIRPQKIDCFEVNFHKAFFATNGDFPFDIFAASFYLLSRYEEYLPHEKDAYGRYAHTNSLAFKEGFLKLPLINIWLEEFKKVLVQKFPAIRFRRKHFKPILSYDIDMAYSYKYKGLWRNAGGFARSALRGEWSLVKDRFLVLFGKKKDPYDCFEWLDALHLYCRLKPYFFFLVAKKTGKYDKNTSTNVKPYRDLITYYAEMYKVGIHPSWQSGDNTSLVQEELEWLEVMADKPIIHSRQHYIRLTLPDTYRELIRIEIAKDFSMGYGSINGFRASVCSSFAWYDLQKEEETPLLLYPFCFMDANSFYEQKDTPPQAYAELLQYYEMIKKYQGMFISIWHNSILGNDPAFAGWREMFELFMKETVYWDAYYTGN